MVVDNFDPIEKTIAAIAMEMAVAISAYSMAVAPDLSDSNFFIMADTPNATPEA